MDDRPRRPIGVASTDEGDIVVVCDDGSVWFMQRRMWTRMNPIPGTPAAIQKAQQEGGR